MIKILKKLFTRGESMRLGAKHILVEQEFEAKDLVKKIEQGESFEELAKAYSSCPSRKDGGDLGVFGPGQMVKPFEKAILEIAVGEVSIPVRTQFGYHLILRTK